MSVFRKSTELSLSPMKISALLFGLQGTDLH